MEPAGMSRACKRAVPVKKTHATIKLDGNFDVATMLNIVACLISSVLGVAVAAAAADWPHAGGPTYNGHADDTNITWPWPEGKPALLWKKDIGEGYSAISAADGRLYTQMQSREGQYVVGIDVETGRSLWEARYNYPWQLAADYPGPYATPTYSEGRIYFADCYGFAGCLDARNGKSLWKLSLTEQFAGKGTGFGYACAPLVEDERVFLPVGGKGAAVVAVSALDGRLLWRAGDDAASYVQSLPISVQGHRQIVTFLQNVIVANDPATGRELWRDRRSRDGYDEHSCIPLYQEPLLFCAAPFRRGARVLKLSYDGATPKAELVWKSKVISSDVCSAVLVAGCIYGSDVKQMQANPQGGTESRFVCVDLATGQELWASAAPGHASVVPCGDKLLLLNEAGFLIVIEASRLGYVELARTRLFEDSRPCWTPPTIYRGRLLVRNHQELACYQIAGGLERAPSGPGSAGTETAPRMGGKGFHGRFLSWLDEHAGSARWDPSPAQLALWYLTGLGLLAVSGAFAWLLRNSISGASTFLAFSVALGIISFPFVSLLTNRLVFTWPVACHSICLILLTTEQQRRATSPIQSRVRLLFFVLFCVCYYYVCRHLFLPSGIGFLCGFVAMLPALCIPKLASLSRSLSAGAFALCLGSFTLYFWVSALVIIWRMGR
jgi:outer membrane protein assembly factor BamB